MKRLSLSLNKILCFTLLCTAIAVPLWGALFMIKLKLGSFGKLFEWVSVKRNIFGVNGRVFILIWFHLVSEIPLGFQSTQFNAQPDIIGGWMNLHQIHFYFFFSVFPSMSMSLFVPFEFGIVLFKFSLFLFSFPLVCLSSFFLIISSSFPFIPPSLSFSSLF